MKRSKSKKSPGDFPKKKRKLGKGKRPPENVTVASFKTGSVVIPAQLKDTQEPTSKRKLPLQVLLANLNHYKPSTRHDALLGLRDLLQEHPSLLLPNLGKIIEHVFNTVVDVEASVRRALCTFLKFLFTHTKKDHLQPFFPVLVAHLTCGLTHINDKIQLDSLTVFDLVLAHYPHLFVPHAQDLLPLFARLVLRHETPSAAQKKTLHQSLDPALSSNPGTMLSKQSSRLEIFSLLCRFLQVILEHLEMSGVQSTIEAPVIDIANRRVLMGHGGPSHLAFTDLSFPIPHVAIVQTHGIQIPPDAFLSSPEVAASTSPFLGASYGNIFPQHAKLLEFIQTLISLLLECWLECSPSQLHAHGSIKHETLSLMEAILNLLCLVMKLAYHVDEAGNMSDNSRMMQILGEKLGTDFLRHFLPYFPFGRVGSASVQKVAMNCSIAHTMLLLLQSKSLIKQSSIGARMLSSICDYFATLESSSRAIAASSQLLMPYVKSLVEVLPLLGVSFCNYTVSEEKKEGLFTGIHSLYYACHPQSAAKRALLQCYSEIQAKTLAKTQSMYNSTLLYTDLLLPWLRSLPNLFVELGSSSPETSALVIDAMVGPARQGNVEHLGQLQQNINQLLGPESIVPCLPTSTQKKVIELLWCLLDMSQEQLSLLAKCVSRETFDASLMAYLVQIVHHRLIRPLRAGVSTSAIVPQFLSFMLSVVVGYSQEELLAMSSKAAMVSDKTSHTAFQLTVPGEHVSTEYRKKIVAVACECLLSTQFSSQILQLLQAAILRLVEKVQMLPMDTVYGLLKVHCCLIPEGGIPGHLLPLLGQLCLACLVAAETGSPLVSDHPLVGACLATTNQMLTLSCEVTRAMLQEFQDRLKAPLEDSDKRVLVMVLISLLNTTEINATLNLCQGDVCFTVDTVKVLLPDTDVLNQQLELCVTKFRN